MLHDWRIWAAASFSTLVGTTIASIAPSTIIVASGAISTIGLGVIALYQKFRQAKRAEDLADEQVLSQTYKQKYESALLDAAFWKSQCEQTTKGSNEWQRLYKESRRLPDSDQE